MKPQEFRKLVWDVREAQREYFKTRTHEVLLTSKKKEWLLDAEISRVDAILKRTGNTATPPDASPERKFFDIVSLMRDAQKEYFKDKGKAALQMARGFEKEVDDILLNKPKQLKLFN